MRFVIDIRLGNAAMQTGDDVASVLTAIADGLEGQGELGTWQVTPIRDLNGNTVGQWSIDNDE